MARDCLGEKNMKFICDYCKKTFERKRVRKAKHRFCCQNHHRLWRREQVEVNYCLNCNKLTTNPKFCSKGCSASYTNKINPKRSLEGTCSCGKKIPSSRTFCKDCFNSKYLIDYSKITIGDLRKRRTSQQHSQIRGHARKIYIKSGRPQACEICGYSNFFEVCHIKAIKDFNDDTLISVVNSLSNLISLCPNHHLELDNGLLTL